MCLQDFILGNQQQASVVFKADKSYIQHNPKKASFSSPGEMPVSFQFPQIK